MLQWVYEAARDAKGLADVIIATDSERVLELCRANGWNARMTSAKHRSGTERVHEVACAVKADVYLNVQGDEPLAHPEQISTLLQLMSDPKIQVGTLKTRAIHEDLYTSNAVKVVCDFFGRALYFSRATIPFDRDGSGSTTSYKHLGFYAYRKAVLDKFVTLEESPLERAERLEQLRFLQNGIPIHVAETPHNTVGVDTEEDLKRAEEEMKLRVGR